MLDHVVKASSRRPLGTKINGQDPFFLDDVIISLSSVEENDHRACYCIRLEKVLLVKAHKAKIIPCNKCRGRIWDSTQKNTGGVSRRYTCYWRLRALADIELCLKTYNILRMWFVLDTKDSKRKSAA